VVTYTTQLRFDDSDSALTLQNVVKHRTSTDATAAVYGLLDFDETVGHANVTL